MCIAVDDLERYIREGFVNDPSQTDASPQVQAPTANDTQMLIAKIDKVTEELVESRKLNAELLLRVARLESEKSSAPTSSTAAQSSQTVTKVNSKECENTLENVNQLSKITEKLENDNNIETPEISNTENNPNLLMVHVLNKIATKLDQNPTNEKNTDRVPLVEKDITNINYKLNLKENYRTWFSLFKTEINLKRLDDIIDPEKIPLRPFSQSELESRKQIVRGLIISHVDTLYQEQILEIDDPREMLQKLEKLKRDEINDTTVSIKNQIQLLQFKIGHETSHEFNLKFDDLIRKYHTVSGSPMPERDVRDFYYQIVSKVIPSIKENTYRDVAKDQGEGYSYIELKRYVQRFEAENKNLFQTRNRSSVLATGPSNMRYSNSKRRRYNPRDRYNYFIDSCDNCGANGHTAMRCRRPVGSLMCYNCHATGHIGKECPKPRLQPDTAELRRKFVNPKSHYNKQSPYMRYKNNRSRPRNGKMNRSNQNSRKSYNPNYKPKNKFQKSNKRNFKRNYTKIIIT